MRGRKSRGRRKKGQAQGGGASGAGGLGGALPGGGQQHGIPIPSSTGGKREAGPKRESRSPRRREAPPSREKPTKLRGSKEKRKRPVSRGFKPPPVPDHIAGAETIIDEVIPVRSQKKKKKKTTKKRPASPVREKKPLSDIHSSETVSDEMDLSPVFPSIEEEMPTPAPGTPVDEEDILEPIEGASPAQDRNLEGLVYSFQGSGFGLLPRWAGRGVSGLAGLAGIAAGGAAFLLSDFLPREVAGRIPVEVIEGLQEGMERVPAEFHSWTGRYYLLLGAGGLFLVFWFLLSRSVRLYRSRQTWLHGDRVSVELGFGAVLVHWAINLVLFLLSAGLGTPWILSRNRRFLLRHTSVKARRRDKPLDFNGTGIQALGLLLLSLVSSPLIPLTLGIWLVYLNFRWIRWEQSNLVVPSPTGRGTLQAGFNGTWGSLLKRACLSSLFTLFTAGLFRPWAIISGWRWIAENTEIPQPPDDAERKTSTQRRRRKA